MVPEIWLVVFSIYSSSSCYGCILKFSRFFKNKFISLKLFDFEKSTLYFQKSTNLTILGSTSNYMKFRFFYHLSLHIKTPCNTYFLASFYSLLHLPTPFYTFCTLCHHLTSLDILFHLFYQTVFDHWHQSKIFGC